MPFTWQVLCSVVFSYQWQEAANFDTIQCCFIAGGDMRGFDEPWIFVFLLIWNVKSQTQQQQSKENKDDMLPRPCHNRALVFIVLYIVGGVVTEIYCGNICLFSEIIWGETHLSNHRSRKQHIFLFLCLWFSFQVVCGFAPLQTGCCNVSFAIFCFVFSVDIFLIPFTFLVLLDMRASVPSRRRWWCSWSATL